MIMRKQLLLLALLLTAPLVLAQDDIAKDTTYWTTKGNFKLLFNQASFSNWVAGGENNVAGNISLNYNFNFKKDNFTWDNKILAAYGLIQSKNTEFEKKTDDRLEYNSLMGWKANNYWNYSLLVNFKTQFTKGYKYGKDENGKEIRTEFTNFWSPANLLIGPGMLWEKSVDFKFNIAPATTRFVFVDAKYTLPDNKYFGIEEGKSMRFELGFNASGYLRFDLMKNISMEQIVELYANYLEEFKNVDLNYTLNINMKVNKYFSTDLIFQTIYDDNAYHGFQLREAFGFGFNYMF
jgi:hypothetical protein